MNPHLDKNVDSLVDNPYFEPSLVEIDRVVFGKKFIKVDNDSILYAHLNNLQFSVFILTPSLVLDCLIAMIVKMSKNIYTYNFANIMTIIILVAFQNNVIF